MAASFGQEVEEVSATELREWFTGFGRLKGRDALLSRHRCATRCWRAIPVDSSYRRPHRSCGMLQSHQADAEIEQIAMRLQIPRRSALETGRGWGTNTRVMAGIGRC